MWFPKKRNQGYNSKRVCWMYAASLIGNPIALQAISTLSEQGWQPIIVDPSIEALPWSDKSSPLRHVRIKTKIHKYFVVEFIVRFILAGIRSNSSLYIASQPIVLLAGWISARFRGVPIIYYTWELYGEEGNEVGIRRFRTLLLMRLERFLLNRVDAVIHASEERREIYIQERGARPANNWVVHDFMLIDKRSSKGTLLAHIGVKDRQCTIVLYSGAFMEGRCLSEIVEAFHMLENKNTLLVFIGKNIQPMYWEKFVEPVIQKYDLYNRVFNLGWISPMYLRKYIADADVGLIMYNSSPRNNYYCTASRLGNYINEGVPVVVPPYPYISRIVLGAGIGICAKSCSSEDIAAAVTEILQRPKYSWNLVFDNARRTLNWEIEAKSFMGVINQVCR